MASLLLLPWLFLLPSTTQEGPAPRNVLLIVSDDHGLDTGAYGNPDAHTPHLDALAAEGVRFSHAFATTASCSASRSVILSGLHNHRTGQYGHSHDYHHFRSFEHVRGLPVLLAEAGYRTARVGKFHVAPEACYAFEEVLPGGGRDVVRMAEHTRGFLESDDPRPFFLYFATADPHRGGPLEGAQGELVPDGFGHRAPEAPEFDLDPASLTVPPWLPDRPQTREELAWYLRSVARLDRGVGRLLEVLEQSGHADDTLVIYLSDHGAAFAGAKTTVYEPGLRAPLIVRRPGLARPGLVNRALVSWVDITPTILDWAGVEPPTYDLHIGLRALRERMPARHGLHGRSFLPVLEEERPEGWDEVYASHTFHEIQMYYPMRVVRDRRYKLIHNLAHPLPFPFASDLWESTTWQAAWREGPEAAYGLRTVREYRFRPQYELYDLEADPHEARNLAPLEESAELLAEYRARLEAFQVRTADPWLLEELYR